MKEWVACEICARTAQHRHHVYGGTANRKMSEKMGMTAMLCRDCHSLVHSSYSVRVQLCQRYQKLYEQTHSREDFMKKIGRSYL